MWRGSWEYFFGVAGEGGFEFYFFKRIKGRFFARRWVPSVGSRVGLAV